MKKLIVALLMSFGFTVATTINTAQADTETNEIKTIVVAADKSGNNTKARVYQLTDKKIYKTNRTMATFDKTGINHWYGQLVEINNQKWWKVGENQYFKPDRVEIVNVDFMQQHGLAIKNYVNYAVKNGVSMIKDQV